MAPCLFTGACNSSHPTCVLRTSSATSSTTNWKSFSEAPMALQVSCLRAMSQDPRIPFGRWSLGRLFRTLNTSWGMSIFIGQT